MAKTRTKTRRPPIITANVVSQVDEAVMSIGCYQTIPQAGAWIMWHNPVWYPDEGLSEVRFDMNVETGGWGRIRSLSGLVTDGDGRIHGIRRMTSPKESGYQVEGRVSIGGKKYRAFTSSTMFELPDEPRKGGRGNEGRLVSVATLHVVGLKTKRCMPPYRGWDWESPEDAASKLDDLAATSREGALEEMFRQYYKSIYDTYGKLADDLLRAIGHRQLAVESRLKGAIAHAQSMENLSDEDMFRYAAAYRQRPDYSSARTCNIARRLCNP